MSLFADYKAEREGKLVIETEFAFAVYSINKEILYLEDVYVVPERRDQDIARELCLFVIKIAKEKGCTRMLGSVDPSCAGAHNSMLALIKHGMKLHSCLPNGLIYFVKDI